MTAQGQTAIATAPSFAACTVAGVELHLLAERAAWLPSSRTLLVADLHIGKAAAFRSHGVPVPGGTTLDALERLSLLVRRHGAERIVFLGDFLHSARGRLPATLAHVLAWREAHAALVLTLVEGNHDRHAGPPPDALRIEMVREPLVEGPLRLCHHPVADAGGYVIAGHLHPAFVLRARANERLRLPCYWFGPRVGVLPAFGGFTGMAQVEPEAGDRIWVIADDRVLALPVR